MPKNTDDVKIEILPDPEEKPVVPRYPINVGGQIFELTNRTISDLQLKLHKIGSQHFLDRDPDYFHDIVNDIDIDLTDKTVLHELYLYNVYDKPVEDPVVTINVEKANPSSLITIFTEDRKIVTTDTTIKPSSVLLAKLENDTIKLTEPYAEVRALVNLLRTGSSYVSIDLRKYGVFVTRSDIRSAIPYSNSPGMVVINTKTKICPATTLLFDLKGQPYITDMIVTLDVPMSKEYSSDYAYRLIDKIDLIMDNITLTLDSDWLYLADKLYKRKIPVSYDNVQLLYQNQFIPVCRVMIPIHSLGDSLVPVERLKRAILAVTIANIPSLLNCSLLCFTARSKMPLLTHTYLTKHHVKLTAQKTNQIANSVSYAITGNTRDIIIKCKGLIKVTVLTNGAEYATYDSLLLQNVIAPKWLGTKLQGSYYFLSFGKDIHTNKYTGGLNNCTVKVLVHSDIPEVEIYAQTYTNVTLA